MSRETAAHHYGSALKVGFILLPEFDLISLSGFVETLRQATDLGDVGRSTWAAWEISGQGRESVTASCGLETRVTLELGDPANFHYVAVVGGNLSGLPKIKLGLTEYLADASRQKIPLIGLGAGSFALAEAGLMRGRRCCLHWPHFQEFKNRYPETRPQIDDIFVEDRGITTCPGGTAATSLARILLERFFGPERLIKVMRRLLQEWNLPSDRLNTPGLDEYLDIPDPRVRQAVFFMIQNLSAAISTEDVAQEAGVSLRQLERLFKDTGDSPAARLRSLRLKQARWLLRNTRKTITDIALECGFADSSHFAKWYREHYDLNPGADRAGVKNKLPESLI